jgi:hypothetical protein
VEKDKFKVAFLWVSEERVTLKGNAHLSME